MQAWHMPVANRPAAITSHVVSVLLWCYSLSPLSKSRMMKAYLSESCCHRLAGLCGQIVQHPSKKSGGPSCSRL